MHSSTGLSKETPQKGLRALLNLAAEVTKALTMFKDTASKHNFQRQLLRCPAGRTLLMV